MRTSLFVASLALIGLVNMLEIARAEAKKTSGAAAAR